jgi:diguanylate cyclase (GGDEF)-like protein
LRGQKTGHPSGGKRPPQGRAKTRTGTRTGAEAGSAARKAAGGKPKPARQAGKAAADSALRRAKAAIRNLKTELAEARARIDELQAWADTDFLLDVFNRRGFERELARSLAYIRRYSGSGALIVLDVDGLKPINDTFGHAAGDVVLKGIVAVLMRHVRSSDVVGRLGGDEFGVLLWNLDEADALAKAAVLENAIDRLTFAFRGRSIVAGASAGVAMLDVASDPAAILDAADRAMYARKLARKTAAADAASPGRSVLLKQ